MNYLVVLEILNIAAVYAVGFFILSALLRHIVRERLNNLKHDTEELE